LLTIAVLGILAAILIPQLSGDLPERLNSGAQIISTDFDYARSLAVANNSSYRISTRYRGRLSANRTIQLINRQRS
jgi:Tfp pilus assembly protein FimT